jgi:tetratricopeptide (TPR) repeat protein
MIQRFGRHHVGLTAAVLARALSCWGQGTEANAPTFRDVAPIIYEHCVLCHQPEGSAPFPLLSYGDVRRRARQIVDVTASRFMPPWLPEPGYGTFAGERRLTDEELSTLEAWVEAGAPEGDPADLPAPPALARGWKLGVPDLVVEMDRSYTLPAEGEDIYRNFVIPLPVEEPRFVSALELHPGNAKIVHHARILVDRSGASKKLDEKDAEPGYDGMLVDAAEFPDGLFLGWSPGKLPLHGQEAFVWQLLPATDLVLQLHMLPTGKPEEIRPSVGLYFTDEPPRQRAVVLQLGTRTIDIPAGETAHAIEDSYVLPADVEVLGIYPHAHYLCHEMQAFATLPDGTRTWLLWIKSWDFYWQDEYRYETPVALPKGTKVTMHYVYDNSAANPRNPFDPPRRIRWGPRSSDEMGDLLLMLVPRHPEDLATLQEDFRRNELRQEVAGYEKMLESTDDEASIRHELAFAYMELGQTEPAIEQWQRVVQLRPAFAEAYYNLGGAFAHSGQRREAISAYERAIELRPDYAEAHNNLGVLLQLEGKLKDALKRYERAIELRPDYAFARQNLGSALLARGESDEAIVHLEEAVRIDPDYAEAHYTLGNALGRAGRVEEEIVQYRKAIAAKPDYPQALNNLGGVLISRGQAREAVALLREAVRLRNDYVLAHWNLANALAENDELDEAASEYREVLVARPVDGLTHLGLAAVLRKAGRLSEALSHYRLAVRLLPDNPEALSGLAWVQAVHPDEALRDPRSAVRLAERASRLAKGDAAILDGLAAAYASAGRYDDAVRTAQRAEARAVDSGAMELAEAIRERVKLYRRQEPYRANLE